jgi:hypothetical protein
MRIFRPILALAVLFIAACNQGKDGVEETTSSSDTHREAVAKFQGGQKRFKELIATVRDENSFDAAKPELDKIVSDWLQVATALRELEPPSEDQQAEVRAMIAQGHRATEPTGEDMLRLISIENREVEVTRWLQEFASAAGAAGAEMGRLYGTTDYSGPEAEAPELDLSNATINGSPIDQALNDPATLDQKNLHPHLPRPVKLQEIRAGKAIS